MNKIVLVFGVEALRPEAIAVMEYEIGTTPAEGEQGPTGPTGATGATEGKK